MQSKHIVLGAALAALLAAPALSRRAQAQDRSTSRCSPIAPARSRAPASPIANGMARLSQHAQRARRRHRRRQAHRRGMRDRLRHQEGRRVLRAGQGQEPGRHQPLFDRHHAAAHPEGGGRQDPDPVDGLRPLGLGRRQQFPVDLQPAGDLLGRRLGVRAATSRERKAASTSSRARRSASSISTRRTARSRSRCSRRSRRTTASSSSSIRCRPPKCRTSPRSGSTSAATGRTGSTCRAWAR